MPERKRKKSLFDVFGFDDDELFSLQKSTVGSGGSGYSISVTYDGEGKRVVKVETQGNVDVAELRRDIERRYPGASIEGLEKQPLIRVVGEEPEVKGKQRKEEEKSVKKRKEKTHSSIRIIK